MDAAQQNHVCFIVGEAQQVVERAGVHVRVNTLVALLRKEGVAEKYLRSFAAVLHPGRTSFMTGTGAYAAEAPVTYRANGRQERRFDTVVHLNANGEKPLRFLLLHEAGHVRAYARGKPGVSLDTPRNMRWAAYAGWALFTAVVVGVLVGAAFVPVTIALFASAIAALVLSMLMALAPEAVLRLLSSAEWKANWFYWRHRKEELVSTTPDGTKYLYAPSFGDDR